MGSRAAAPLVAAAVGRERDAEVKVALLSALGALAGPAAVDVAARELARPAPGGARRRARRRGGARRRGAPSHACSRRSATRARSCGVAPSCCSASPAAPAPRRRCAPSLSDRDGGVARAAALALSGRPTATAQAALTRALDHGEESVRRIASTSVARWSGESVAAAAPGRGPAPGRAPHRREALRGGGDGAPRRGGPRRPDAADPAPARPAIARATAAPGSRRPLPGRQSPRRPSPRRPLASARAPAQQPRASVAVVEAPAGRPLAARGGGAPRAPLRPARPHRPTRSPGSFPAARTGALAALVARGAAVQRGARYFPA